MAPKTRPSLTSLSNVLATKAPAPAPVSAGLDPAAKGAPVEKEGDGRVQVLVRMTPAKRKALRRIALEQDTTVQALAEEALEDLLRRYGA